MNVIGFDRGLKIGGYCKHKGTSRTAIVLGIFKRGLTIANVQWESDGTVADVLVSNLEYVDSVTFNISKLKGKLIFSVCLVSEHNYYSILNIKVSNLIVNPCETSFTWRLRLNTFNFRKVALYVLHQAL